MANRVPSGGFILSPLRKSRFLKMDVVDEADLLALIEGMDTAPPTAVVPARPEPEQTPEPEPEQKSSMGGVLIILLFLAGIGGAAFHCFKTLRPEQGVQGGDRTALDDGFIGMVEGEQDGAE